MRAFIIIVLLLAVGIGVTGFVRGWFSVSTSSSDEKTGLTGTLDLEKVKSDRDAALSLFQSARDKHQKQADSDLKAMDVSLVELKAKARTGRAVTKDSMNETVADLSMKTEAAHKELRELKNATTANWDALKKHFDTSMTALQGGYERASKQFMVEVANVPAP